MPVSKQWVLAPRKRVGSGFQGLPTEDDFEVKEEHTPELAPGEILVRALFFSVDPIIRLYMDYGMGPGDPIPGRQVGRVVESRHKMFTKGKLVVGSMGWQTYCVLVPEETQEMCGKTVKLVDDLPKQLEMTINSSSLPKSACLGVLGVPGLSAYLGLVHLCKAKAGETVVISSAAGQIGHLAGQIAKILGLVVIGFTGDGEKSSWIKTELGFDWAFNYKTQDVGQTLKIAAPSGVDIFLDSVGGSMYNSVLSNHMNLGGRICIFGNLSLYNNHSNMEMVAPNDLIISLKGLSIFGFNVYHHIEHFETALDQLAAWCRQGKLNPYEHIVEGFENLPKTFIEQLEGKSQGKVIVRTG